MQWECSILARIVQQVHVRSLALFSAVFSNIEANTRKQIYHFFFSDWKEYFLYIFFFASEPTGIIILKTYHRT